MCLNMTIKFVLTRFRLKSIIPCSSDSRRNNQFCVLQTKNVQMCQSVYVRQHLRPRNRFFLSYPIVANLTSTSNQWNVLEPYLLKTTIHFQFERFRSCSINPGKRSLRNRSSSYTFNNYSKKYGLTTNHLNCSKFLESLHNFPHFQKYSLCAGKIPSFSA